MFLDDLIRHFLMAVYRNYLFNQRRMQFVKTGQILTKNPGDPERILVV